MDSGGHMPEGGAWRPPPPPKTCSTMKEYQNDWKTLAILGLDYFYFILKSWTLK